MSQTQSRSPYLIINMKIFLTEEVHKKLILYDKRAEMLIAGKMNKIAPL